MLVLAATAFADEALAEQPLEGPAGCPNPPDCHFAKTTHPDAQWFADAGSGLFIHWGIASVEGSKDLSWSMVADKPWDKENNAVLTPEKYWQLAERFNPGKYDPDEWAKAARAAGFRYVVLTSRHHDGFALWPSAYTADEQYRPLGLVLAEVVKTRAWMA